MVLYETLLLLSPELGADARTELLASFKEIIAREGGKVEAEDAMGMRDLAYPVQKHMRGYYHRYEYSSDNSALVAELERNIRINDSVFKYITVKLPEVTGEGV